MGVAYITRFIRTKWTPGYKVFECATKYMRVEGPNALSLIIVPPSSGNSWQHYIIKLFVRLDLYSKFVEFWGMFRQWKMRSFGTKENVQSTHVGACCCWCMLPLCFSEQHPPFKCLLWFGKLLLLSVLKNVWKDWKAECNILLVLEQAVQCPTKH